MLKIVSNKNKISEKLEPLFTPIYKTANGWLNAIEKGNAKLANDFYTKFSADFPKLFIASM